MRKLLLVAAAALLGPTLARAQLELGARVGWAIPAGYSQGSVLLAETVTGALPLQLDLGWRLGAVTLGGYASYALGRVDARLAREWDEVGEDTRAGVVHLGVRGAWAWREVSAAIVPWAGLAVGWERAVVETDRAFTYTGPEGTLECGAEWKASAAWRVGPFLGVTIGRYGQVSTSAGSTSLSGAGTHTWITLGLRGQFGR